MINNKTTQTTTTGRTFKQNAGGWLDTKSGHVFMTAVAAMNAAKRESKRNAQRGIGMVVISREPTTALGAKIVRAIQGA